MAQKLKNNYFKKYLNFIIVIVIIILLIILYWGYQDNSPVTSNNGEGEKFSSKSSLVEEDNSCKYNKGENCFNAPSKCICKNDQICSPERTKADNLGCYTFVCGDGYQDKGETSETCCLDAGCSGGLVCDANLNKCVKPECPFDCCINDFQYQDKSCSQYYTCESSQHSCNPDDSDNDASPDYLEIQAGTDRFNPDSDGDTVLDGYDNHPLSSYLPRTHSFNWRYGKEWLIFTKNFEFDITLSEDVIASYEKMPKINLLNREDIQLEEVAQKMNQLASEENYDDADKLMMVISFYRSFNYDYTKADFSGKGLPDWANFPMETIVKKQGLCADSAVMTSALLKKMGYDAQYLTSNGCNHAIIGVPFVDGITLDGSERYAIKNGVKYYHIDPTSRDYSGNIIYSTTSKDDFGATFCQFDDFVINEI